MKVAVHVKCNIADEIFNLLTVYRHGQQQNKLNDNIQNQSIWTSSHTEVIGHCNIVHSLCID